MSVIDVQRPAAIAPAPPSRGSLWDVAARVVLLGVLVVAAVLAIPSARPQASTAQLFLDDLRSGHVTSVRYVSNSVEVHWSEGWRDWHRASLDVPLVALPPGADRLQVASRDGTSEEWLLQAIASSGHPDVDYAETNGSDRMSWTGNLPWHRLSVWAAGAATATFLLMLWRGGRRFGNRWAWLWVMMATSGLGAILYLALEPSPLWRRPSRQKPFPERPALLGGGGLLVAICLAPALGLLSLLVNAS